MHKITFHTIEKTVTYKDVVVSVNDAEYRRYLNGTSKLYDYISNCGTVDDFVNQLDCGTKNCQVISYKKSKPSEATFELEYTCEWK